MTKAAIAFGTNRIGHASSAGSGDIIRLIPRELKFCSIIKKNLFCLEFISAHADHPISPEIQSFFSLH